MTGAPIHSGLDHQTTLAAPPRCPRCRYDLAGLGTEICPECGGPCDDQSRVIAPLRRRLWMTLRIATYLILPIVLLESVMVGMYAKSLIVYGSEAAHGLWIPIAYFAIPSSVSVCWIAFGERAAREPEATEQRLDAHWGNSGLAIGVAALFGWIFPIAVVMNGVCLC